MKRHRDPTGDAICLAEEKLQAQINCCLVDHASSDKGPPLTTQVDVNNQACGQKSAVLSNHAGHT